MNSSAHPRLRGMTRLTLILAALAGGIPAATRAQTAIPERVLTPADLEKVGLKGTVRPSAEMYDPAEGLHFVRGTDSALVLAVAALGGAGNLRETMALLSKEVTAVSGVGDEAYLGLAGWMLMFRKGDRTIQMLTGMDVASGVVFLTPAQMADLAKVIASRL